MCVNGSFLNCSPFFCILYCSSTKSFHSLRQIIRQALLPPLPGHQGRAAAGFRCVSARAARETSILLWIRTHDLFRAGREKPPADYTCFAPGGRGFRMPTAPKKLTPGRVSFFGTADGIRTHDLQSRSLALYPAELRPHSLTAGCIITKDQHKVNSCFHFCFFML